MPLALQKVPHPPPLSRSPSPPPASLPSSYEGVSGVSFGFLGQGSAIMRGPMVSGVVQQLLTTTNWGELEYLVPASTSLGFRKMWRCINFGSIFSDLGKSLIIINQEQMYSLNTIISNPVSVSGILLEEH